MEMIGLYIAAGHCVSDHILPPLSILTESYRIMDHPTVMLRC